MSIDGISRAGSGVACLQKISEWEGRGVEDKDTQAQGQREDGEHLVD